MRTIHLCFASIMIFGTAAIACSSSSSGGGGTANPDTSDSGAGPQMGATDSGAADAGPVSLDFEKRVNGAPLHALATDDKGNMFVAGELLGATDFGGGKVTPSATQTAFLAEYDKTGKLAWVKLFTGTADMQQDWALAPDGVGGVYLAGVVSAKVNLGGSDIDLGFPDMGATTALLAHFDGTGKHLSSGAVLDCKSPCGKPLLTGSTRGVAFDVAATGISQTPFVMGGTQDYYQGAATFRYLLSGSATNLDRLTGNDIFGVYQDTVNQFVYDAVNEDNGVTIDEVDWTGAQSDMWSYPNAKMAGFAMDGQKRAFMSGYMDNTVAANQFFQTYGPTIEWTKNLTLTGDAEVRMMPDTVIYDPKTKTSIFAVEFEGKVAVDTATFQTKSPAGKDDWDIFLVRFDHKGKLVAQKQLGSSDHETVRALSLLPDGRVVVAGDSNGAAYLAAVTL